MVSPETKELTATHITAVINQLKQLRNQFQFGIVIGGGNLFRGTLQGPSLGISASIGHHIGMLGTIMNGLIIKDLLEKHLIPATLLCAIPTPGIGQATSQQEINTALDHNSVIIFTGGTGNPYFTTDTNAVLRGLQIDAFQIWKGTNVDGIYSADPHKHAPAMLLNKVTYQEALHKKLAIMDATAFTLAEQHQQTIRVFNIFTENALLHAAANEHFGSTLHN